MTPNSWDAHYTNDLNLHTEDDEPESPSDLSSWFDDVDAPARTLVFLTSDTFPLSPSYMPPNGQSATQKPSILDLGTGNGSTLFQLRLSGFFTGPMLGIDYSVQSIELARKLAQTYGEACSDIAFEVMDLMRDSPSAQSWWPASSEGFDLVLDKGTFDAISLSSETITNPNGTRQRICELYPAKATLMVKSGGFLLVTSCNWTEDEVVRWFTASDEAAGRLKVWGRVKYPTFKFGGQEGQGVASICFRRTR